MQATRNELERPSRTHNLNYMTLDYQLDDNQVAILWYDTREVQIMNVPNLDEIEDMEQYFSEVLELDMSNAYYMT